MNGFDEASETTSARARLVRESSASGWRGVLWYGPVGSGAERCVEEALDALMREHGCRAIRVSADDVLAGTVDAGGDPAIVLAGCEHLVPRERDQAVRALGTLCPGAVLLASTDDEEWALSGQHALRPVAVAPISEREARRELSGAPQPVAPNVAAELCRHLCGLRESLWELVDVLHSDELRGDRPLPDPLPLVGSVRRSLRPWTQRLSGPERRVALLASVAADDRVDVLTEAAGVGADELMESPLLQKVSLVGGRFRILDPRMRQVIHSEATLAERTWAHRELSAVLERRGDREIAAWHQSLGALARAPRRAPTLICLAQRQLGIGNVRWAYAIAREAVSHAGAEDLDQARLLTGISAVNAGWALEAREQLRELVKSGRPPGASTAMPPLMLAMSRTGTGELPDLNVDSAVAVRSPTNDDRAQRVDAGRALLIRAMLLAQRGQHDAARRSLDRAVALGSTEWAAARTVRSWAVGCTDPASDRIALWRGIVREVSMLPDVLFLDANDGHTDSGRHATGGRMHSGVFRSPATTACEKVAAACALAAEGRHEEALESVEEAELQSPAALVFDGIIHRLRHRECICVRGGEDHRETATESVSEPANSVDDVAARSAALAAAGNLRAANAAFALCDLSAEHSSPLPPVDIDVVALALAVGDRESALARASRLRSIAPESGHAVAADLRTASADEYAERAAMARARLGTFTRITERALVEAALSETGSERSSDNGEPVGYPGIRELYSLAGAAGLHGCGKHVGRPSRVVGGAMG